MAQKCLGRLHSCKVICYPCPLFRYVRESKATQQPATWWGCSACWGITESILLSHILWRCESCQTVGAKKQFPSASFSYTKLSDVFHPYQLGIHYSGQSVQEDNYSVPNVRLNTPALFKSPFLETSVYQISPSLENWIFLVPYPSCWEYWCSTFFRRDILKKVCWGASLKHLRLESHPPL